MPTYEYVCEACGAEHEVFQSIKDDPLKKCPSCKKSKLRRKLGTGGGFIFKGSGFYITDYRSESYKDAAKKDAGGDSKPTVKDSSVSAAKDGKSEATPAAGVSKTAKSKGSESRTSKPKGPNKA